MVAGGGRWRRSAAGARGGPERRRGGRRRRLYGDVDCLAPARFGAGHPGPPPGGRRLRPRPERAKRRVLRVALVQRPLARAPDSATTPRARCSMRRARRLAPIGGWCDDNGVDAWFDQSGYLGVSTGEAFDDMGLETVEAARALGRPEAVHGPHRGRGPRAGELPCLPRRRVRVPTSRRCSRRGWRWACATRLLERGVEIFENSQRGLPRMLLVRSTARTRGGSVRAKAAVLAVGPSARSFRPLRSRLSVTSSHIVLTEPVPDVLEEIGWTGGECVTDGRTLLHYFRTTRDGRIAFGWGGGRLAYGSTRERPDRGGPRGRGRCRTATCFGSSPQLEGRRITHAWGGPIDVSPSHIAQIGTLPCGPVHFALGFTGNGVGPTHLAGRALASLALDRRDRWTSLPLVGSEAGRLGAARAARLAGREPRPPRVPAARGGLRARRAARPGHPRACARCRGRSESTWRAEG